MTLWRTICENVMALNRPSQGRPRSWNEPIQHFCASDVHNRLTHISQHTGTEMRWRCLAFTEHRELTSGEECRVLSSWREGRVGGRVVSPWEPTGCRADSPNKREKERVGVLSLSRAPTHSQASAEGVKATLSLAHAAFERGISNTSSASFSLLSMGQ